MKKFFLFFAVQFFLYFFAYGNGKEDPSKPNSYHINKIKTEISISTNDSLTAYKYILLAKLYRKEQKLDSSLFYAEKSLAIAKRNNILSLQGKAFLAFGTAYVSKMDYDKAIEYYKIAIGFLEKSNDTLGKISLLNNMGTICFQQNKLIEALGYYHQSLDLSRITNNGINYVSTSFNIGLIYFQLEMFDKSLKQHKEIIKYIEDNNIQSKHIEAPCYHTIAAIYQQKKEFDEAISYYNKSLQIAIENEDIISQISVYISLGDISLDRDIQYSDSLYLKALQQAESLDNEIAEISTIYLGLAMANYKKGEYQKSLKQATKSLNYAQKYKQTELERDAYGILKDIYLVSKDFEKAYWYLNKFYLLRDSLSNKDLALQIDKLETKYQSQQKENKILVLSNENIKKEAQLTQAKFTTYSIFGVLLLIVGLGYLFWLKQKQKQKFALMESTVAASEDEKNRIGKELHDDIAGSILKIVYETEKDQVELSNNLLETYNKVRNISHQLDGTPIHGEIFFDRLLEIIPENKEGQIFNVKLSPNHMELREPIGTHVYRIVQELITNNLKHAKASKTEIGIILESDVLSVMYKDNGVGTTNFTKGNGYHNMENRVELMKASIEVGTKPAEGFEVVIRIPYKKLVI